MMRRLLLPALWLTLAMAQYGPPLEPEGWPLICDCLLRAVIAFPLTLWALVEIVRKRG